MEKDDLLRNHLQRLLDWEDAHAGYDRATSAFPSELRDVIPMGLPYSAWQILEHIRLCQFDILNFCRNPDYEEPPFEEFWPKSAAPDSAAAWDQSIAAFKKDREALKALAYDPNIDLFSQIPHGSGQTYLREILLVAD